MVVTVWAIPDKIEGQKALGRVDPPHGLANPLLFPFFTCDIRISSFADRNNHKQ